MKNAGNRNFGIPLPLLSANPYRMTAKAALCGEISVPEGPLAVVDTHLLRPWMHNLSGWLRQRGYVIYFTPQKHPIAKYTPSVLDFMVQRALKLPLRDFDLANPAPSLQQIAVCIQQHCPEHPQLYDICSFLADHLDAKELAKLLISAPCLNLGN